MTCSTGPTGTQTTNTMMITLKFFLTFVVVTAAAPLTSASDQRKKVEYQRTILAEIIESIKDVKARLTKEIFVQKVMKTEDCTHTNFCKAGNILLEYKAQELGLKEKDWLLPRRLIAYTRDVHCKDPASKDRINIHQLLDNIHWCAQKEYSKPFDASTYSPFSYRN